MADPIGKIVRVLAVTTCLGLMIADEVSISVESSHASHNAPVVIGKTPTKSTTPTWSWTSGGGGNGTYRFKLDNSILEAGATITTMRSFTPQTPLPEGVHVLFLQQQDVDGKWSAVVEKAITIDLTPPNPPMVSRLPTTATYSPTWIWSGGGGGKGIFRYKLDSSEFSTTGVITTATSFTPDSPLTANPHTLYVQEKDGAGNWSATASKTIFVSGVPGFGRTGGCS